MQDAGVIGERVQPSLECSPPVGDWITRLPERTAVAFFPFRLPLPNFYFANSTQRVSRSTVTRICPGYIRSASIFREMLRARANACSSLT